ncbi:hypothetical protein [Pseudomonas sp. GL-RE-26]|uniref:hypothetical protein n=1 Tax=Pseudomonas sp. GL-RE-26 TaxID=2832390 RepID=UPI001CC11766|nr:hypothetical protein [Pseudomonas sp. GL-RE-26]
MKPAPKFNPYPEPREARYLRWFAVGAALLVLTRLIWIEAVDLPMNLPRFLQFILFGALSALWLLAFLVRILVYCLDWHSARYYEKNANQVQQGWWEHHRQKVALIDTVLVGPACTNPLQRQALFSADHRPPTPQSTPGGATLKLLQVFGDDLVERERQLAKLLVLQWQAQRPDPCGLQPLACYWQGSLSAWRAFAEQMTKSFPQIELPEKPESWEGIFSLDSIIDRLHGAPADARILCAGCQSWSPGQGSHLPAGEAALLWLLGPQGGVGFTRGEWFDADTEQLPTVAERALQQSKLTSPPSVCVSFSQADAPLDWNTGQHLLDANFGALGGLEGMVVQTLAATCCELQRVPCAWVASDPNYTFVLGVMEPDDSTI